MEAHCRSLCDGLRRKGHDVVLFASSGSEDPHLFPICDFPYDDVLPWDEFRGTPELYDYQAKAFANAWREIEAGDFDVVHNNSLFVEVIEWADRTGFPCVTSQHVPPFRLMSEQVCAARSPTSLFTVTSQSQRPLWPADCLDKIRVVANGVDCAFWKPASEVGNHFVWAGRITPNKGLAEAVAAAGEANAQLRIFGPIEDKTYYNTMIAPNLTDAIAYCGHRDRDLLAREFARAKGMLLTPMWDEPFGLVAAEALACGTPVIAFDRGAMREVVASCGTVVPRGDVGAMARAMASIETISRQECRRHAERHLSIDAMIEGYEDCYASVFSGKRVDRSAEAKASASRSSVSSTAELLA
ncbi:glycosyltransferase [Parapontixanthobacter aurantiacus]|nr:glycosyltransferase [Parapontixanthobacter aurantiacus]